MFFFSKIKNFSGGRSFQNIDDDESAGSHTRTELHKVGESGDTASIGKGDNEGSVHDLTLAAQKKSTLQGMEIDGEPTKSETKESSYQDTKSFFFELKGKGNIEDIAKEREWRLNRIKKLHKPMDYKKLKQHELSFMSQALTKKAKAKEEMMAKLKEREKSYKISYKSKVHNSLEKEYKGIRHGVQVKHDESQKHRVMSKKYGEKIKEMNMIQNGDTEVLQKILESRFPKDGPENKQW